MTATETARVARVEDLLAHADWLRRLAGQLVHDVDPEDLVQETWSAALRAPPAGTAAEVRPWLARVLRNLALTRFRGQAVARRSGEVLAHQSEEQQAPSPEVLLERAATQRQLAGLVMALDEPYRSAVLLRYYEGKTAAEIARSLGVPAGTVRWRLSEGIDRLRGKLDEAHGGERERWRALLGPLAATTVRAPVARAGQAGKAGALGALGGGGNLLVAVLLLLGGAGAWMLWRRPPPLVPMGTAVERVGRGAPALLAPEVLASADPAAGPALVEGEVRDPDGRPVAGATVGLSSVGRPGALAVTAGAPVRSGGDGAFRFAEVPPGQYLVTATSSDWAGAFSSAFILGPGGRHRLTLVLGRDGQPLTGQVLDAGGGPIPGARVWATLGYPWQMSGPQRRFETTADEQGGYRLLLDPREYTVAATAPGYAGNEVTVAVTRPVVRDLRLQPAARVSGQVVERGTDARVAGATVQLLATGRFGGTRQRTTDDQGRFTFDDLEAGGYNPFARKGALVGGGRSLAVLALQAVEGVVIEVERGQSVAGRITGEAGRGLAGVLVTIWNRELVSTTRPLTRSSANGAFLLEGVLPGRYELNVDGAEVGYSKHLEMIEIADGAPVARAIQLQPSPVVAGQVLGINGRPARGVLVRLEPVNRAQRAVRPRATVADGDGRFRLAGEATLAMALFAWDTRQGLASTTVDPAPGQPYRHFELRLAPGALVAGTVSYDDGGAAAGVSVAVTRQASPVGYDSATTDEQGRFEIGNLLSGRYTVQAARKKGPMNVSTSVERPHLRIVEVASGARLGDLSLVLPRGGRHIAGMARLADGSPALGAVVIANAEENGRSWKPEGVQIEHQGLVGDDGRFVIEDVPRQTFTLWAVHAGLPDVVVKGVAADRSDVALTFAAASAVEGRVRTPAGKAVQDFTVTLLPAPVANPTWEQRRARHEGVREPLAVHDAEGRFLVEGIEAGTYEVKIATADGGQATATFTARSGQRSTAGPLVVQAGITMTGTLVAVDGAAPIRGAEVRARVAARNLTGDSDGAGKFVLRGVPPGETVHVDLRPPSDELCPEYREIAVPTSGQTLDLGTIRFLRAPDWRARMALTGRLGMRPVAGAGPVVVGPLRPEGPAAGAGLLAGETIVSIDGYVLEGLGAGAANYYLARAPGQRVSLVVKSRAGETRTVELVAAK